MIPTIETERLVLSEWSPADVDEYARICAMPEVMRYMWPARPATPAESAYGVQLLREHWLRWGFGHWAVHEKESGRFVGRTGAKRHHDWEPDARQQHGDRLAVRPRRVGPRLRHRGRAGGAGASASRRWEPRR